MTVVIGHTFNHSTFHCFLFLFWTIFDQYLIKSDIYISIEYEIYN